LKVVAQLARTPRPVPPPQLPDSAPPFLPELLRMLSSHRWPVLQTAPALTAVTLDPFVGCFAADLPLPAQLGHRGISSPCLLDEIASLMKDSFFIPRQNRPRSVT
jgi:hypothetical protein